MRNFTRLTKIPTRQFTRAFSQLRKVPEFKLIKFDAKSKGDYEMFRELIIENMEFSALQFLIPNINDDIKDLRDKQEVSDYFDKFSRDKYLRDAYNFVTQNHDMGPLGYKKIMREGVFIGNTGWIMHEIGDTGLIKKIERGIHLKQDLCSPDLSENPKTSFKPRLGARVIRQVVQELYDNKDSLDLDGQLISSILKTNKRSQAFTKRYRLNVGDPTFEEGETFKWTQRIGDFVSRTPEILGLLDKTIDQER
jgi:hypothetical protein